MVFGVCSDRSGDWKNCGGAFIDNGVREVGLGNQSSSSKNLDVDGIPVGEGRNTCTSRRDWAIRCRTDKTLRSCSPMKGLNSFLVARDNQRYKIDLNVASSAVHCSQSKFHDCVLMLIDKYLWKASTCPNVPIGRRRNSWPICLVGAGLVFSSVTLFGVAVSKSVTKKQEEKSKVALHDVSCFARGNYFMTLDISMSGKLSLSPWTKILARSALTGCVGMRNWEAANEFPGVFWWCPRIRFDALQETSSIGVWKGRWSPRWNLTMRTVGL